MEQLLPAGLRLQCSLHVLANCSQTEPLQQHLTSTVTNMRSDLFGGELASSSSSSSWTSTTANLTGAINLGTTGVELGKRVLDFTSERALSAFTSLSGLLFSPTIHPEEKTQPFVNLLSDSELLAWTRSCLGASLLVCVQRGYLRCLSLLLQAGFRVGYVTRPLGTDCVASTLRYPTRLIPSSCTLLIEQSLQPRGSGQSRARPWTETPDDNGDSAIHAAVRFDRVPFLEEIVRVSVRLRIAVDLSL
ncbi:unnamed protein product [Echinostoma caproni]|uniref:Uncharacterized protein n=1 Tax=Echinostoma caproni TaxID=27848 RepID=A0A3P8G368_9TREM|nr:unnamed protein product [Echinostoma caproni]